MSLSEEHMECPSAQLLNLIAGSWTLNILWLLSNNGPTRFGELKRKIAGISAKVLTERLRMLEEEDIIYRDYKPTIPPQVTYGLAARGEDLAQVLALIDKIAQKWQKVASLKP
ncbi:helix-turn-helix transcriptional regulator [Oculatella sp. FACHB-28]|uniref:winged helix-turn-helix transcriptional regulator n=1 Tax=Cyanophyceae TaxID=3028117 RepID=UPI001688F7BF|nr:MULTISPECIES: helix-turn-helix domain-containing protein [Cyanophyceae]MBD2001084.1 helix-turn-helix transcriptional regulator [Leptolyngbya sp. FACHB-541]MBD2054508.1 helix-turn-helix transcriptional regulator [Oculatella sp. FACHB-28]